MASSTLSPTKHQGGSFLLAASTPEEIFSPEDFTEEHRAIARTTEEFWNKEVAPNVEAIQHQEPGLAISIFAKVRTAWSDRRHPAREIRRHGNGSDIRHDRRRRRLQRRLLFRLARRAHRYRHAAVVALWNRGAKAALSSQASHRRDGRGVLPQRTAGRLRRAGCQDARRSESRRKALHPQWPKDVDHQRRRR